MYRTLHWWLLTVVAVIGLSAYYAFPLKDRINLGLDLQGGMHLVLKVDTSKLAAEARTDATERALEVIRNRIDEFGVKEPAIHRQGEGEIVVQLPGVTDRQRALEIIGRTAHLEFRLVADDPELLKQATAGQVPAGYELLTEDSAPLVVEREAALTGDALTTAAVRFDESHFNQPIVGLTFNADGAKKFAALTTQHVGRRLAIVLDGKLQSAPRINEPIPSGEAVISGSFTPDQATDLALVLRVGALPAPVEIEEERTIGPLLGQDSIRKGVRAAIVGIVLVLGFMAVYYLVAGLVADVALALNLLIILGGLGLFNATLTLPGIAGIILTLGMAVDANVLINERIREELKLGRTLRQAVTNGYTRAFTAIFDSNVTTLIAAFLLFQFGTGPIRGFAVTLTIGLIASLFTAIVVTRVIFELLLRAGCLPAGQAGLTRLPMLHLIRETSIDFARWRTPCLTVSAIVTVAGLGYFLAQGRAAYGIDFTGGQLQQYAFAQPVDVEAVRGVLKTAGVGDASIQQYGESRNILIRTAGDTAAQAQRQLTAAWPDNPATLQRVEQVGPSVGRDLRQRAWASIAWSIVGISLYVGVRFRRWSYGVAGVVALLHDVLITVGALALTHRPLSLELIAALLTIAGYSINDTIVIYDRIRELLRTVRKTTLTAVINLAVNQMLGRTLLTSGVTLLTVIALYGWGGDVLNDFAFALLVGFVSGVYSTVYIASPMLIAWARRPRV
ncbi:MAG: protein translocase subunit SecD [Candidatus Omnitrophica bacterium]|nr:protein translocase subunit SecD [Candidatus Omnitrophota bacterium]